MAEDLHELVAGLSDKQFEQLYGPLARLHPSQAAGLLDGLAAPWWIVGGWAIEAFTGHPLSFKAAHARSKDTADLEVALPKLPPAAKAWLAETITRLHPGHSWLHRFSFDPITPSTGLVTRVDGPGTTVRDGVPGRPARP